MILMMYADSLILLIHLIYPNPGSDTKAEILGSIDPLRST